VDEARRPRRGSQHAASRTAGSDSTARRHASMLPTAAGRETSNTQVTRTGDSLVGRCAILGARAVKRLRSRSVNVVDAITRNVPRVAGRGDGQPIVFAHGFGCDSNMWRFVAPHYERDFKVVTFDHVGHGGSNSDAFDPDRYSSLDGYATDVIELCEALELSDVVFVGHSVSAMIGAIACIRRPDLFDKLVMVGPPPPLHRRCWLRRWFRKRTSSRCSTRSTATTSVGPRRWLR